MYEPLIMIGLGVDLLGALIIIIPEIKETEFIKKRIGAIGITEQQKLDSSSKRKYLKWGVILLMMGFVAQLLGHSF